MWDKESELHNVGDLRGAENDREGEPKTRLGPVSAVSRTVPSAT